MAFPILAAALLAQSSLASQTAPAPAGGGEWTFWESEDRQDYFLDAGSGPDSSGTVRFRIREVLRPAPGESLRYYLVIAAFQLDCRKQTIALESVTDYSAPGVVDRSHKTPDEQLHKEQIFAGSNNERLYLHYCPASMRKRVPALPTAPVLIQTMGPPAPPIYVPPVYAPPAPPAPPPPPPPPPRAAGWPIVRARPAVPLISLFTADDYPAAALRLEEEGTVRYRLAIDRRGMVTGCTVVASSGSAALDSTTCRLVSSRARFTPARNAKGKKIADSLVGSIRWRLPEEPAEPPPPRPPQ
jgi:TonB family protein